MLEMHDFRPTAGDEDSQNIVGLQADPGLLKALAVGRAGLNANKVVPILEVPSSESGRSSSRLEAGGAEPHSARMYAAGSVRSQESYGFQPRESAIVRTTSMKSINNPKLGGSGGHGENQLLTGHAINMLTTEAPEEEYKSVRGPVRHEPGLRDSINFSNDAGKISAIDFHAGDKKNSANSISFEGSEIGKDHHRSHFGEELLASSAESLGVGPDGIPSKEFTLKPSKLPSLTKAVEVSIDIDWPAERIEEEYRKHQTAKNQLLFGPNWEYTGEALDLDKAKKEVYRWKRDEERRRSIAVAQAPQIEEEQKIPAANAERGGQG